MIWFSLLENPPVNKNLRKRKRAEEDEEIQRKIFHKEVIKAPECEKGNSSQSGSSNNNSESDDDDDESPVDKFRRGDDLPSDLDIGSNNGDSSDQNDDEGDDGDWNMMGAALEREFLGLE